MDYKILAEEGNLVTDNKELTLRQVNKSDTVVEYS